jgi:hypothetical protein
VSDPGDFPGYLHAMAFTAPLESRFIDFEGLRIEYDERVRMLRAWDGRAVAVGSRADSDGATRTGARDLWARQGTTLDVSPEMAADVVGNPV